MKIGILADIHGKAQRLQSALDLLAVHGAEAVVVCGDIGSPECLRLLGRCGRPVYAVIGNMDHDAAELKALAEELGVQMLGEVVEVALGDGRALAATHGHDEMILRELIADGRHVYVCHGHTHRHRDERIGNVRVINPGALFNVSHCTATVLDTQTDELKVIDIPH